MNRFLTNFVLGGFLIAVAGWLANIRESSFFAGLIYGSLPIGLFYLYWQLAASQRRSFVDGSMVGGLVWVAIASCLYLNVDRPLLPLLLASVAYAGLVYSQL